MPSELQRKANVVVFADNNDTYKYRYRPSIYVVQCNFPSFFFSLCRDDIVTVADAYVFAANIRM